VEYCNEEKDACGHRDVPDCPEDGLWCNGVEYCNEEKDACGHRDVPDCPEDGLWCNGVEYCNEEQDACGHREAPDCPDDGLWCNGVEYCSEEKDACGHREVPDCADDGLWCNGVEYCNEEQDACGHLDVPDCSPRNVHSTYLNALATSVAISWRTDNSAESRVEYGITDQYGSHATGTSVASVAGGYVHHVLLTGLSAGQKYHYRCGDAAGNWSTDATFRAAPGDTTHFTFGVVGDVQGRTLVSEKWTQCADWLAAQDVSYWLPIGDLVNSGQVQAEWEAFFAGGAALTESAVILPILGNHDLCTAEGVEEWPILYQEQFHLPDNGPASLEELAYTVEHGDVLLVVLEANPNESIFPNAYELQSTWLQEVLSTSSKTWKFAFLHEPIYSSGGGHGGADRWSDWNALFEQYHVNAVFSGHTHYFETTVPISDGVEVSSFLDGTLYYNAAGVNYNDVATGDWYTAAQQDAASMSLVCVVTVHSMSTLVTTHDFQDGSIYDRVLLPQPGYVTPEVSISAIDAEAAEASADSATVTVTRTGATVDPLELFLSFGGEAVAGEDFEALAGRVTIDAGNSSVSVTIVPIDDDEVEDDETVVVTLTPDVSYSLASATTSITIADND
jgi:hypothetical protein